MKLGLAEVAAIEQIGTVGPLTPGALGRALSMPSGTVTALIDRLEYKRMVERRPNPNDRRGLILSLTEAAMIKAGTDLVPLAHALTDAANEFSGAERQVILRFLERAVTLMDGHRKQGS